MHLYFPACICLSRHALVRPGMPLYPVMHLHAVHRLFDNQRDGSRKSITWEMAVTRIGRRSQSTGAIRGCGGVTDNPQCGQYALFTDVMFILGFESLYACLILYDTVPISELSTGHFSWTRPDPTRRNVDPTRPDPRLPTKSLTRPDPTRPDPLTDPSPICIVFNWIIIFIN